jgi:hypothetical protein
VKIGIPLLVIGVSLLVLSIPFSVILLVRGFNNLNVGNLSGEFLAYLPIAGVVIGFVMVTIGATRVFKN